MTGVTLPSAGSEIFNHPVFPPYFPAMKRISSPFIAVMAGLFDVVFMVGLPSSIVHDRIASEF